MLPPQFQPGLMQFSIERYHQLVASGMLGPDDRIELIEGMLVQKMTKSPRHVLIKNRLAVLLRSFVSTGYHLRNEDPVTIEVQQSEPEPDLAIVRGGVEMFAANHPTNRDVVFVAEIAVTSLAKDQARASVYAAGEIPLYVIVDATTNRFLVHQSPTPSGYQSVEAVTEFAIVLDGASVGTVLAESLFADV